VYYNPYTNLGEMMDVLTTVEANNSSFPLEENITIVTLNLL
jgi:hypothetical protein